MTSLEFLSLTVIVALLALCSIPRRRGCRTRPASTTKKPDVRAAGLWRAP